MVTAIVAAPKRPSTNSANPPAMRTPVSAELTERGTSGRRARRSAERVVFTGRELAAGPGDREFLPQLP